MSTDLYLVDAFTDGPGSGNRAGVLLLEEPADPAWMAILAAELALPATVFASAAPEGVDLRWFAPTGELPSCGHGTLAAARALREEWPRLWRGDGSLRVRTTLGELECRAHEDPTCFTVALPAAELTTWEVPQWVDGVLGADVVASVRSPRHGLVVVADEQVVHDLNPDLTRLAELDVVGLAVTAEGTGRHHVVSRWFVPRHELEDHATGTAHTLIGPYWAGRLGRSTLVARQASPRGAVFALDLEKELVHMTGTTRVLVRGHLDCPGTAVPS